MARSAALLLLPAVLLPAGAPAGEDPKPRDLSAVLSPLVEKHGIPGMCGGIVTGNGLVAVGAAGVRERGKDAPVATADRFHLGSCTKAMTATLCGILVEEETLRWDTTVGGVFGSVEGIDRKWKGVTLEQLLVHRAGAPASLDADGLWGRLWSHRGTPLEQRRTLVEGVITKPPVHAPGTEHLYSNAGYAIAGAMAEAIAKKPWETLMRERLFGPLGMESAGFGAPGSREAVDQPRGHTAEGTPVLPGPGADNPAAIGPGGTVHASLGDWAKFVALHLRGARGEARLLRKGTFAKLHEPFPGPGASYAMGWAVATRPWARGEGGTGRVLTHSGSNTMWFAVAWIAPERGFAVLVACNQGGEKAVKACDDAAAALIRAHLGR